jgi:hypothetical protein
MTVSVTDTIDGGGDEGVPASHSLHFQKKGLAKLIEEPG